MSQILHKNISTNLAKSKMLLNTSCAVYQAENKNRLVNFVLSKNNNDINKLNINRYANHILK